MEPILGKSHTPALNPTLYEGGDETMLVHTPFQWNDHVIRQDTKYQIWEFMEPEVGGKRKKGPSKLWKKCLKNHVGQIGLKR